MTELFVGKSTEAEPLCICIHVSILNMFEMNYKHILMADLINMVVHFYTPYDQTVDRWETSPTNLN